MSDVTTILGQIENGDPSAADQLIPLVYEELRRLAAAKLTAERPEHTLQATALVHEAFIRLVDAEKVQRWDSKGHFFAAAAEAMRRILINHARERQRLKRGGGRCRIDLNRIETAVDTPDGDLLALDEAIRHLSEDDPLCAQLVKLRFFGGLSHREAAESLGIARRTADRHWAYARAWLFDRLQDDA